MQSMQLLTGMYSPSSQLFSSAFGCPLPLPSKLRGPPRREMGGGEGGEGGVKLAIYFLLPSEKR